MDSARPFQVAAIATFLTSTALLFAWLRERVGDGAGARGGRPRAVPGRCVGGPPLGLSDRLLRLDGGRARDRCSRCGESRRAATWSPACCSSCARVLEPRDPVRDRRRRRDRHRPGLAARAPSSSSIPAALCTGSGTSGGGTRPRTTSRCATSPTRRSTSSTGSPRRSPRYSGWRRRATSRASARYDWGRTLAVFALGVAGACADPPARLDPTVALGTHGDRALVLAALGVQPDSGPRPELQPVSVHRRDPRPDDRGGALARRPRRTRPRSASAAR